MGSLQTPGKSPLPSTLATIWQRLLSSVELLLNMPTPTLSLILPLCVKMNF